MVALKTLIFSILVPGSVAGVVPWLLSMGTDPFYAPWTMPWVLGVVPIAAGAALYFWCAGSFAFKGDGTPLPADPPKKLVVSGPYRWFRNPMYVAVLSIILGQALLFQSFVLAGYATLVFAAVELFVLLYEEPKLTKLFGQEYLDYKQSVPRWIFSISARKRSP